ncbi:MAG: baseplate J/gp47 family protein [Burkholderiales bacterium]|nr:baseplate J/gp47 family protein [Nitrosomonas sp.]MCP5244171.1 baseplate J/gp47 family protein [Burkholderiales bacterium]
MNSLTDKKDLTRWNRSGLGRFRYVDGNAITFLETLRLAQRDAFTTGGKLKWKALETAIPQSVDETPEERQARWLQQYYAERRDYGWEILRSYARAAHILGEYVDVYANESFIRTATQWQNIRRLVEMLDYHPAPPASAETPIVLFAKTDKSGTVEAGFAFKNSSDDGSKPSVFETLSDLDVDEQLNEIRIEDWNKSQINFIYDDSTNSAVFPLSEPVENVSVGTLGVLLVDTGLQTKGLAVKVTEIAGQQIKLQGEDKPAGFPHALKRYQVRLLLKPDFKQTPKINGDDVVILKPDHGLSAKAVVAWKDGYTWMAAFVEEVQNDRVRLSRSAPASGTELYLTAFSEARDMTVAGSAVRRVILPLVDYREQWGLFDADLQKINSYSTHNESGQPVYTYKNGSSYDLVYYVPKDNASTAAKIVATVLTSKPQNILLEGDPGDLATGDWMILQDGSDITAARIDALTENEKDYQLKLSSGSFSGSETLFGNFEVELRPLNYAMNEEPAFLLQPQYRSDSHCFLPVALEDFPELLTIGRSLIVEGRSSAMEVTVKDVDELNRRIKIEPAIPGSELTGSGTTDDYTRYSTKIYGNVVQSGHGETRKEKILGSGDATQTNQQFDFDVENVSFVTDPNFTNGVRAAISIRVDSRTWKQVSTLNDSEPEDMHYVVRMNENGTLQIEFGDGIHGRRLPTGSNNVRIVYRVGGGLSGNLVPCSLKKIVKPSSIVDSIRQPIPSSGGNDMESGESMRDNAPGSILTLERAVSLADFTHLATRYSGVWQARAYQRQGSVQKNRINIAIVPAGGGELGGLGDALTAYFDSHSLPGVTVNVLPFESIILDLKITIRVKTDEFDQDIVTEDVLQALKTAFSLKNSKLGCPLYLSAVFKVVEGVTGVANSQCEINPDGFFNAAGNPVMPRQVTEGVDGAIKRVSVHDQQVIYLDSEVSVIDLTTQAFSL